MKKLLLVIISAMLLLSFSACSAKSADAEHIRQMETELEVLKQENSALNEKNSDLKKQISDLQAVGGKKSDSQTQAILDDLVSHTDLIPIKAELGGTFRYFPECSKVLSQKLVFTYAEDGHLGVDMLLNYVVNADRSITWALVAYDTGDGWVVNG